MKKRMVTIALGALLALGLFGATGCASESEGASGPGGSSSNAGGELASLAPSGEISVNSREDGSGTRSAFIELLGIEEKNANGEKVDMTTPTAVITNSTSVMMTAVAGDPNAIGYISLGSLNDTVKAVEVDGVEASVANVKSGAYKIARPFNIVTQDGLSDVAQDFVSFIMSADGQAIVEAAGYIAVADGAQAYVANPSLSGKVVVAGSSSVTPVMEKLAEAYQDANPNVSIEVQQSDSTTGVNMAMEGTCDIGMASRDLKDSETGVASTTIAQDGIAIIVNKNSSVDGLTSDQIKGIYVGDFLTWEEALA